MAKKKNQITKKPKDHKIRVPRTSGLTMALKAYRQESNPNTKKKILRSIQERILRRYIEDGYRLNGKLININELAHYLNLKPTTVIKASTRVIRTMTMIGDGENGMEELYRALLAMGVQGALADRGMAINQVEVLNHQQGNQYVPFLTPALNQAIKNLMDSNKPILELIKTLTPSDPSVIINNQNAQQHNSNYIGTNEAVQMIDQQRGTPLLEDADQQRQLEARYLSDDVPEVKATAQRGFKVQGEMAVKKPKRKTPTTDQADHTDRREDDGEIIPD